MAKASAANEKSATSATSSPGTPTETQRKILAAALELFAERGFAATTTAAIAKQAGVAEKTIFAHFATKDRLFDATLNPAALELLLPEAIGGVRETLSHEWSSLTDLYGSFMRNRLAFVRKNPAKLKLIAQALMLHPELADLFVRVFHEHLEPRLARVTAGLEAAGELRKLPRSSLVRIVMSVTAGYMLARFVLRPGADWDDEAEIATMLDVLVNGLKPRA
jgi:AcrR family transcriptional regulator